MLVLDTNVLARFLLADDEVQHAAAASVLGAPSVFVGLTVVLELSWLLMNTYGYPKRRVLEVLTAIMGLPNLTVDRRRSIERAIAWAAQGLDFADALHLASAQDCEALVSFDRRFAE